MSTIINGVDFDVVTADAIKAVKAVIQADWPAVQSTIVSLGQRMASDALFVQRQLVDGKLDAAGAHALLQDQKIVARMHLRTVAIITLQLADAILDAMANVFKIAINRALGWDLLQVDY